MKNKYEELAQILNKVKPALGCTGLLLYHMLSALQRILSVVQNRFGILMGHVCK